MLDYEAKDGGHKAPAAEICALDNGHLYAWGQRVFGTTTEFELAERLSDALDIIQILAAECRNLSSNDFAYAGTRNMDGREHSVELNDVDDFVISGQLDARVIVTDSDWRKGKS